MKAREGDLVETRESLLFDVKGLVHPPDRTIAFIRYFPHEKGERRRDKKKYGKVYSLSERYNLLKARFPEFLVHDPVFDEELCEVPTRDVKTHYQPAEKLEKLCATRDSLDALEKKALQLAERLKEGAGIPWDKIGISGSILANLHTSRSDVDPVVYGSNNCRKTHSALKKMLLDEDGPFKPYAIDDLKALFDFRSKDSAGELEDFVRTESKKALQGKFAGTDYFIRFVKDWNETAEQYGDVRYRNVGNATVKATIVDDSDAIFTPCRYTVKNATALEGARLEQIREIVSFRGRFCEQARTDETVVARGKMEQVIDTRRNSEHFRLLLGNKPSDFMILA